MENTDLQYLEDLKDLRDKTEKTYLKEKLKTTFVGGFDKGAVLNFINDLREQELKAREIFTGRITELTGELEALQKEFDELKTQFSEISRLKNNAEQTVENLTAENNEYRDRLENGDRTVDELGKKCIDYESQIKIYKTDYEEVQTARQYKTQYEELLTDYEGITHSRDEYIQLSTVLQQENADLKKRGDKLERENDQLNNALSSLTAEVRKDRSNADMKLSAYGEIQKYLLGNLFRYTEDTLNSLKEMETRSDEFCQDMREDLDALKCK